MAKEIKKITDLSNEIKEAFMVDLEKIGLNFSLSDDNIIQTSVPAKVWRSILAFAIIRVIKRYDDNSMAIIALPRRFNDVGFKIQTPNGRSLDSSLITTFNYILKSVADYYPKTVVIIPEDLCSFDLEHYILCVNENTKPRKTKGIKKIKNNLMEVLREFGFNDLTL